MRVGLVRVRPQWALGEGPPRARMVQLAQIIAGHEGDVVYGSYFAAPLNVSPTDVEAVAKLAGFLSTAAEEMNSLLVDFAHPRIVGGYARIEWLLAEAIRDFHLERPDVGIVVYMESIATEDEQLGLLHDEISDGLLELCDQDGKWVGPSQENRQLADAFVDFVDRDTTYVDQLASRFIRWRGVFARAEGEQLTYFKYQYTLKGAAADQSLSSLIGDYVDSNSIAGVIFDDPADPGWLEPCVEEVGYLASIPFVSARELALPDSEVRESSSVAISELKTVASSGGDIVIVIPAYRNGQGLRAAERKARVLGLTRYRVLAILMDETRLAEGSDVTDATQLFRSVSLPRGGSAIVIDYFLPVPIEYLDAHGWLVRLAGALNEVRPMTMDIEGTTRTGIWSLLEDYGVGVESPAPSSRLPIHWYPQLKDLSEWDARWIVHILAARLLSELGCEPEQLLLVIPDEENATRELCAAAEALEGLAVVSIERDAIEGKVPLDSKSAARLRDYSPFSIAALDESMVSGDTLGRIDDLVMEHAGKRLDACTAVLSAQGEDRGLFSWRPYPWKVGDGSGKG